MLNPWVLSGLLLVMASTAAVGFGFGHHVAATAGQLELAEYRELAKQADLKAAGARAAMIQANIKAMEIVRLAGEAQNQKVIKNAEENRVLLASQLAIARADAVRAGGLRVARGAVEGRTGGASVPTPANANGKHDAYLASTVELSERVTEFLYGFAARCDREVESSREMQDWLKAHGFLAQR